MLRKHLLTTSLLGGLALIGISGAVMAASPEQADGASIRAATGQSTQTTAKTPALVRSAEDNDRDDHNGVDDNDHDDHEDAMDNDHDDHDGASDDDHDDHDGASDDDHDDDHKN